VSEPGKAVPNEGPTGAVDPVLRAKYLDYCSARLADSLLRLTADEMYVLAQEVARESRVEPGDSFSYEEIVRLATWRISQTIVLPTVNEFEMAYREDPGRFEEEMLGLWERGIRGSKEDED
jgi:hypothetical protein